LTGSRGRLVNQIIVTNTQPALCLKLIPPMKIQNRLDTGMIMHLITDRQNLYQHAGGIQNRSKKRPVTWLWMAIVLATVLLVKDVSAQDASRFVSDVWIADNGDGTYTNPIIHADYSDPDVIRVGEDFYMVSSSFNATPGLPVLHSRDLVNWELIGHALNRNVPEEHFRTPRHAQGVWAPSFRNHNDEYYIYWGDPDFGIYMIKTDHPSGKWSEPHLVKGGKGLIDPSPLWDDDGRAYLVHAFAGSRAGIKSLLVVQEMTPDGKSMIGEPVLAFDGHDEHETVEGPKFYKKGEYYYILAPAGGVTYGWQLALRSKDVFGPYEEKIVMHTGSTDINGPHQGGMVELESGESWFVHFQDKFAYGRIVHLNPVRWEDGWPLMGIDKNGDGIGEPVRTHKKPDVGASWPAVTPPDSDEFNANRIGLQWQWQANPLVTWAFPAGNSGFLRLFATQLPDGFRNYWDVPHLLLQKFPAPAFTATTKFEFTPNMEGEKAGLIIMGRDYSYISVTQNASGLSVSQVTVKDAEHGNSEEETVAISVDSRQLWFRVVVDVNAITRFSYSTDGENFNRVGSDFQARQGGWIGAKVGIFCSRPGPNNDSGFADFDWFRVEK
jgi:beta-xylosidase